MKRNVYISLRRGKKKEWNVKKNYIKVNYFVKYIIKIKCLYFFNIIVIILQKLL